jgi:hypothetical protein
MTELEMSPEKKKKKLWRNKIKETLVNKLQLMFLTWHEPNSSEVQVGSVKYPVESNFWREYTGNLFYFKVDPFHENYLQKPLTT